MALSSLQKLLSKSPPPMRILASLHNPFTHTPSTISLSVLLQKSLDLEPRQHPFLGPSKDESSTLLSLPHFQPISSIVFSSFPVLASGSSPDRADEDGGMWADSVKKKRKKKMNKHKYRKLRKRLRKQT